MNDDDPDDENEASPKIRRRQAKTLALWGALYVIAEQIQPATTRQTYYQAVVRNIVDKTEAGYHKVQANLVSMRREGRLPYEWITDLSRVRRKPWTNSGPDAALREAAENYRKSLWDDLNEYVEIWVEKDALVGVLYEVTDPYDVPLMAARGFSSETYLNEAAQELEQQNRPCYIYHFGDYDPTGWWAGKKIDEGLKRLAPTAEIHFENIAVRPAQISAWNLPTRETKISHHSKNWPGGPISCELDAIEPNVLRDLVRNCIERHLPSDELARLQAIEDEERRTMMDLLNTWRENKS